MAGNALLPQDSANSREMFLFMGAHSHEFWAVGLPDAAGREQIARIHTGGMQQGGHLVSDVTSQRIALATPNYAGDKTTRKSWW